MTRFYEVVCPDNLVRHLPYANKGDAEAHAKLASDPSWFKKRSCRLAPKPSVFQTSMPPCGGGEHFVRRASGTEH